MREVIFNALKKRTTGSDVRFRIQSKDGETRWAAVSWQPIYDEPGECMGFRSSVQDISRRKQAEDAIQEAYADLENRVRERTADLEEANVRLRKEIAERRQSEKALRRSKEELGRMSSRLLTAQEEERKKISRDLHDGIGQTLSALKFGMERSANQFAEGDVDGGAQSLEAAVPIVGQAIEEVRRTQRGLRPPVLDDLGILPTISWFCRECGEMYAGIRIEKQVGIGEEQVPTALKIVLFRVLQEAVNNAAKHAAAGVVRVSLTGGKGKIELKVQDDGRGFCAPDGYGNGSAGPGLGLKSMRERVELSGGSFSIQSHGGKGTTVCATWAV
jgi:signal transduction histidine kinase